MLENSCCSFRLVLIIYTFVHSCFNNFCLGEVTLTDPTHRKAWKTGNNNKNKVKLEKLIKSCCDFEDPGAFYKNLQDDNICEPCVDPWKDGTQENVLKCIDDMDEDDIWKHNAKHCVSHLLLNREGGSSQETIKNRKPRKNQGLIWCPHPSCLRVGDSLSIVIFEVFVIHSHNWIFFNVLLTQGFVVAEEVVSMLNGTRVMKQNGDNSKTGFELSENVWNDKSVWDTFNTKEMERRILDSFKYVLPKAVHKHFCNKHQDVPIPCAIIHICQSKSKLLNVAKV